MRIGLLIYDLRSGGAERVICKWSEILSETDEVFLYNFDDSSKPEYDYCGKLKILYAPSKKRGAVDRVITTIKRYRLLKRELKKDGIDVLVSFCSTANFPAMFQRISRLASIRVFSEYDSYKRIYRFLLKHTTSKLLVQTKRLKQHIVDDVGPAFEDKIIVFENPVSVREIKEKMLEEPPEWYSEKIRNRRVICFTASFKHSKNHCNLIRSFRILHEKHPETVLTLIGSRGKYEGQIKNMVTSSELKDDVIFVGKTLNPFSYEKTADLFVLPSLYEGIPNAMIEALVVGLPVVSTDCLSGPREILYADPDLSCETTGMEMADYGILVENFDGKADFSLSEVSKQNEILADAMEKMLFDEDTRERYVRKAEEYASSNDGDSYRDRLRELMFQTNFSKR